jgi:hypothetical protein
MEPVNKRITSRLAWVNGKEVCPRFDPPRDRSEFELIV